MKKYFIEANVYFSYNTRGITYPYVQKVNFSVMLKKHGVTRHSWAKSPNGSGKVLCFNFDGDLAENAFDTDMPFGLKISSKKE